MKGNNFLIPLLLSILFHILLFIGYILWGGDFFLPKINTKSNREVALEFVQPEIKTREIVETPEDAGKEKPPERADLASDKNAAARDMNKNKSKSKRGDLPFSEGISDVKEIIRQRGEKTMPVQYGNTAEKKSFTAPQDQYATNFKNVVPATEFNKNVLLGKKAANSGERENRVPYKQTESSADDVGGISFNTYNWNFAPYLIELKKRIQRNIYPPPAFTRLGFGGENVLKFRIYPNGRLEGPIIVNHRGEEALIETSRKAVEMSAPFMPLPDDFPEKFLEVTANFKYYVMNY